MEEERRLIKGREESKHKLIYTTQLRGHTHTNTLTPNKQKNTQRTTYFWSS